MRHLLTRILLLFSFYAYSQGDFLPEYNKAVFMLQHDRIDSAYVKLKNLEKTIPKTDTLYKYALWYQIIAVTELEANNRLDEKFEKSLQFGLEAHDAIQKGKSVFNQEFLKREPFMIKNIIVSNFGMGKFEEAQKWKDKLYAAKEKNELPEGIDQYFNFDYFRFENKNIWGYEWYHKLPQNRFNSSFTKVVYYVYSTNPDGSDKDQLYRFHVLMFHGSNLNFDYVLTKRVQTAEGESSGTLYKYTYKEDIDFAQLQLDIKEVLKGNLNPEIRTTVTTNKK